MHFIAPIGIVGWLLHSPPVIPLDTRVEFLEGGATQQTMQIQKRVTHYSYSLTNKEIINLKLLQCQYLPSLIKQLTLIAAINIIISLIALRSHQSHPL